MKERPILFRPHLVKEILEGRKTQTRRVITPQPVEVNEWTPGVLTPYKLVKPPKEMPQAKVKHPILCPYGLIGDQLWVREAFYCNDYRYPDGPHAELLEEITYRADHESPCRCEEPLDGHWRPSIHMPRWASRLTLEITDVWVERLQDISGAECDAEGIVPNGDPNWHLDLVGGVQTEIRVIREAFAASWDLINGKRHPWASNPWLWVVEFKPVIQEAATA